MRKLRTFLHVFKHSIVPLDYYYHKIRTAPLSFSLKYFISLVIAVTVVTTMVKASIFVSEYPPEKLGFLIETLEEDYPDDFIVRIDDLGRLSTNYDKPFLLFSPLEHNPQPMIVVDAKAEKEKIYEYGSRVLMTERSMVIRVRGKLHTLQYQINEPLTFTKVDVTNVAQNSVLALESYWVWLAAIVIGIVIIAPLFVSISHLISLAIISAVTYVVLQLLVKRKTLTLLNVYQISLHAVTVPLLIIGFTCITGLRPGLPYWYFILNYIFLAGGIYEAYFEKRRK